MMNRTPVATNANISFVTSDKPQMLPLVGRIFDAFLPVFAACSPFRSIWRACEGASVNGFASDQRKSYLQDAGMTHVARWCEVLGCWIVEKRLVLEQRLDFRQP